MTYEKTSIEGWTKFLKKMKTQLDKQYRKDPVVLVIDGHAAHRSLKVDYSGFKVMMTPSYTSYLNSQETVWSILK